MAIFIDFCCPLCLTIRVNFNILKEDYFLSVVTFLHHRNWKTQLYFYRPHNLKPRSPTARRKGVRSGYEITVRKALALQFGVD